MTALIATDIAAQDLRLGDVVAPADRPHDTRLVATPADREDGLVLVNFLALNPATVHQATGHLVDHGLTRAIAHRVRAIAEHVQAGQKGKAIYEFTFAVVDLNAAFAPVNGHLLSRVVATASLKLATGLVAAEIGAENAQVIAESTAALYLPPFRGSRTWVGFDGDGYLLGRFSCSDPAQAGEAARAEFGIDPVYLRELSMEEVF